MKIRKKVHAIYFKSSLRRELKGLQPEHDVSTNSVSSVTQGRTDQFKKHVLVFQSEPSLWGRKRKTKNKINKNIIYSSFILLTLLPAQSSIYKMPNICMQSRKLTNLIRSQILIAHTKLGNIRPILSLRNSHIKMLYLVR